MHDPTLSSRRKLTRAWADIRLAPWLATILAVCFTTAGLLWVFLGIVDTRNAKVSHNWPTVTGVITHSGPKYVTPSSDRAFDKSLIPFATICLAILSV